MKLKLLVFGIICGIVWYAQLAYSQQHVMPGTRIAKTLADVKVARIAYVDFISFEQTGKITADEKYGFPELIIQKFIIYDAQNMKIDSGLFIRPKTLPSWYVYKGVNVANFAYIYSDEIPRFLETSNLIISENEDTRASKREVITFSSSDGFQLYACRKKGKKYWKIRFKHSPYFNSGRNVHPYGLETIYLKTKKAFTVLK